MKNQKLNAVQVWKQMEDLAVPRLHLSVFDRAVYSHLLRHSRLEGRLELQFSILWLARGACVSCFAARKAVRRLVGKGALRLAERSRAGHVVKVRLPEEIRSLGAGKIAACAAVRLPGVGDLEMADFLETRALREAIHAREGGFCFYCLRRLRPMVRCLDHVVPRVRGGRNGYRNLVSSCAECNSQKRERRAEDFLRWLCREGRLSAGELSGRFRALARLAAGKLRPSLLSQRDRGNSPGYNVRGWMIRKQEWK
jgi:5-methylcytosine-specific restriction endonuclease McrA